MNPRALGAWLGAINVLFCAIAIGLSNVGGPHPCDHSHSGQVGQVVFIVCITPAVLVGRWIGALAEDMQAESRWHRLFVMFGICVTLVALLGAWGELETMIAPVLIPSAVGCLILERRTRAIDPLPAAAVERS